MASTQNPLASQDMDEERGSEPAFVFNNPMSQQMHEVDQPPPAQPSSAQRQPFWRRYWHDTGADEFDDVSAEKAFYRDGSEGTVPPPPPPVTTASQR